MEKGMRNRSPWDLSFGWSQIEAVIELLFLFSGGPTSNHTRVQMRGDQICDAELILFQKCDISVDVDYVQA